ncbi:hypothetical protein PMSD_00925 [Paenibacillus macquariensis subsp. defensor]|nr:hypothetical protein PMSD_00925 [Paenibacillus macquariensis subsp. defensor]
MNNQEGSSFRYSIFGSGEFSVQMESLKSHQKYENGRCQFLFIKGTENMILLSYGDEVLDHLGA